MSLPQECRKVNTSRRDIVVLVQDSFEGIDCLSFVTNALCFYYTSIEERRILCRVSRDNVQAFNS